MTKSNSQERRRVQRTALTTFCPAEFTHNGERHHCLMTDLSRYGARFQHEEYHDHLVVSPGDITLYAIKTPYGESSIRGRVVWTRTIDECHCWGVEFTDVPSDNNDPLISLIDSPF